jgi:hypothetical protein
LGGKYISRKNIINNKKVKFLELESYKKKDQNIYHKIIFPLYLKSECKRLIKKIDWHKIIVSNECGLHQSIILKYADENEITTISHQVSSGIVNKDLKRSLFFKLRSWLLNKYYSSRPCKGYGYYSDEVWLMGKAWQTITKNKTVKVIPNGYYYNFKEIFSRKNNRFHINNKTTFIFFGGPLSEINIVTKHNHKEILKNVLDLTIKFKDIFNIYYKPHPQEKLIFEENSFRELNILDIHPEEALSMCDIAISVSSSMSLQARLLGIYSIGFHPQYIDQYIKSKSVCFFDDIFENLSEIDLTLLKLESNNDISSINDYFENNLDLKSELLSALQ